MSVQLVDPTGILMTVKRDGREKLASLEGKRVGFIFNQHALGVAFWNRLESEIRRIHAPSKIERVYKDNTWAPAAQPEVARLLAETDYVLVGLGA